jgi:hypothetical protein
MAAGRPAGTTETPYQLIKSDLKETLKQQRRIRQIFDQQLTEIQEELRTTKPPMKQRLEIMNALAGMTETLTKSMQQAAKYVMAEEPKDSEGKKGSETSLDDVMKEIER